MLLAPLGRDRAEGSPHSPRMPDGTTISGTLLILSIVAVSGLLLGHIQIRGAELGVSGVLFTGLAFGHIGARIDPQLALLLRDLGLVLFVYSVGMRVGPGFLGALRRQGLPLNLAAAAVVVLGVGTALAAWAATGIEPGIIVGVLSGATTNTPSLAAGQQTLAEFERAAGGTGRLAAQPGLGYAVAYPFGVLGTNLAMVIIRRVFGLSVAAEREALERQAAIANPVLARANLEVTNSNVEGRTLDHVPALRSSGVVVSRIFRNGALQVPQPDTALRMGDVLLAVGPAEALDDLRVGIGRVSALDLRTVPGSITARRLIVTRPEVTGCAIADLRFPERFGAQLTRISRAEIEMSAAPGFALQYGDHVVAVGDADALARLAVELGDSRRSLDYPHLAPMFLGIALGILLGTWPIAVPGAMVPVKLGLAGGPLIVAIALGAIGRVGPLIWYMPTGANYMLREVGLVLFLAVVGLQAGGHFMQTLVAGSGLAWMTVGACITLLPPLVVGLVVRRRTGMNYLELCGLLAGSMTAPAALSVATRLSDSEAPLQVYATVYPLVMILRVVSVQVLAMVLM